MNKYKTLELIGDGTYGMVWKGIELETGETIAIKKLKTKIKSWNECVHQKEVKVLGKLKNNPNIIKLKEVIREPNSDVYFIFEFADCNLYQMLERQKKMGQDLSESKIKDIIYQLANGLSYIHNNGYFHRDLKPENILIQGNVIKIADFGLAKEIVGGGPLTDYVCTRWYRAPECVLRSNTYTPAMDIFALGAIMAELFMLKPIFPGKSEIDQLSRLISILGTPKLNDWPEGFKLIQKMGMKFPNSAGYNIDNLIPTASQGSIKFISDCLNWDPAKRPTANQILNLSIFDEQRNNSSGSYTSTSAISKPSSQSSQYNPFNTSNNAMAMYESGSKNYVKVGANIDFGEDSLTGKIHRSNSLRANIPQVTQATNHFSQPNQMKYNQSSSINSDLDNYLNNFNYNSYRSNNNYIPLNANTKVNQLLSNYNQYSNTNTNNNYANFGSHHNRDTSNNFSINSKLSNMAENDLNTIKLQREINKKKLYEHEIKKVPGLYDSSSGYDNVDVIVPQAKFNSTKNVYNGEDLLNKMYGYQNHRNQETKYNFPMPFTIK